MSPCLKNLKVSLNLLKKEQVNSLTSQQDYNNQFERKI